MRIQKYLSQIGYCSRRKAEELVKQKKIKVNDVVCKIGEDVDKDNDIIKINNKVVERQERQVYIALHKPIGFICSNSDKQGRTIFSLLSKEHKKKYGLLYPVGRLDKDSHGLVLITNDGELTNILTHPSSEHEKEYDVTIDKRLSDKAYKQLTNGMIIDHKVKVNGIEIPKIERKKNNYVVTVVLKEGKNRQIRKMFGNLGYTILNLERTRIAKLKLSNITSGNYKFVKKDNII